MVSGSHHIDAGVEKLLTQGRRNGKTARQVLSIHDGQVDFVLFTQVLYALQHRTCVNNTKSRSEEHTSELQSLRHLVCRLLLEKKKILVTHPYRAEYSVALF